MSGYQRAQPCTAKLLEGQTNAIRRKDATQHDTNLWLLLLLLQANVCKQSDGLFLSTFHDVAQAMRSDTPPLPSTVTCDDQLADSCLTRLVQAPQEFDVLCCPNLYGDLVSDLAGGMIGSLGLCPSGNIGEKHALFEPAHGSAPDIAGQGIGASVCVCVCVCVFVCVCVCVCVSACFFCCVCA